MHLLHSTPSIVITRIPASIFEVQTCKYHACVVKTGGTRSIDANLALLALVVPHSSGLVASARDKSAVGWVQVDLSDHVRVSNEGAQDVVVVQTPVHDPL